MSVPTFVQKAVGSEVVGAGVGLVVGSGVVGWPSARPSATLRTAKRRAQAIVELTVNSHTITETFMGGAQQQFSLSFLFDFHNRSLGLRGIS